MSGERQPRGTSSRARSLVATTFGVAIVFSAGLSDAQPHVAATRVDGAPGTSLRGQVGLSVAARLLATDSGADRVRAIERLGAIGTPDAVGALLSALDQGSSLSRDPEARLTAVRVLAAHASRDDVRPALIREMTDAGEGGRFAAAPLGALIRETAAMALARAGDDKALAAIGRALVQGSVAPELVREALWAYPPSAIEPLIGGGRTPLPPAVAKLMGELGDLRAIAKLRLTLSTDDVTAQTTAAVALAKLGDGAPLPIARGWLARRDPRLLTAAAEVLATLGAKGHASATSRLLETEATRSAGIDLAFRSPSPILAAALAKALDAASADDRGKAIAALGRAGGSKSIQVLLGLLGRPDHALAAAHALALMPGEEAREALAAALAKAGAGPSAAKRLLVRAATLRALSLGDAPSGLEATLVSMLQAKDASDRAAGAFGLVATGARSAEAILKGADAAVVAAVSRASLARGSGATSRALLPFLREGSVAAGVAMLGSVSSDDLATSQLVAWAEAGGPLSPLAARALPARDHAALRPRIERLLRAADPLTRAHVALGLARDPEPEAATLLTDAYRFEEDASVRRAIVRALSARSEVQRRATLVLARDLDPDGGVRALAASALAGRSIAGLDAPGSAALWIQITSNDGAATDAPFNASVVRADGTAAPVTADPDGALLVPGLGDGDYAVMLAREPQAGDPATR